MHSNLMAFVRRMTPGAVNRSRDADVVRQSTSLEAGLALVDQPLLLRHHENRRQ